MTATGESLLSFDGYKTNLHHPLELKNLDIGNIQVPDHNIPLSPQLSPP
jgi:hypothetical protein